jgi:hypothetical protein
VNGGRIAAGTRVTVFTTNGGRTDVILHDDYVPSYSATILDGYRPAYLPTRRVIDSLRIDRVELAR